MPPFQGGTAKNRLYYKGLCRDTILVHQLQTRVTRHYSLTLGIHEASLKALQRGLNLSPIPPQTKHPQLKVLTQNQPIRPIQGYNYSVMPPGICYRTPGKNKHGASFDLLRNLGSHLEPLLLLRLWTRVTSHWRRPHRHTPKGVLREMPVLQNSTPLPHALLPLPSIQP